MFALPLLMLNRSIIETTGDNTPELKIPVRANATPNLRYPKRFGFRMRDGQHLERTIRISTRRGDAPKVKKVVDRDELTGAQRLRPSPITGAAIGA